VSVDVGRRAGALPGLGRVGVGDRAVVGTEVVHGGLVVDRRVGVGLPLVAAQEVHAPVNRDNLAELISVLPALADVQLLSLVQLLAEHGCGC